MMTNKPPYTRFLLCLALLLLSTSCSDKEALTDPAKLERATLGCFHTSFSYAKNRHGNDLDKASQDFKRELYPCMVRNILGAQADQASQAAFTEKLIRQCPFNGLESVVRTEMVACLERESLPLVQANRDRIQSE